MGVGLHEFLGRGVSFVLELLMTNGGFTFEIENVMKNFLTQPWSNILFNCIESLMDSGLRGGIHSVCAVSTEKTSESGEKEIRDYFFFVNSILKGEESC